MRLGMGDRLFVERAIRAGKAIFRPEDRLQVICGTEVIDGMRCATVRNMRTRTVLLIPIDNLKQFCKRVGFDGLEEFE